jgi:hypothetical protein
MYLGGFFDISLCDAPKLFKTHLSRPGLTSGFWPAVVGVMLRQGFTPDDIAKVGGGNYSRIFGKVTAGVCDVIIPHRDELALGES